MKGSTRNLLIVVIVITLLVFGVIFAIYNNFKTEPMNANQTSENKLEDANKGLQNQINEILGEDNNENNEQEDKLNQDENSEESTNVENNKSTDKETTDSLGNNLTPGESKAIQIAKQEWKKEWGNLNDVSFNVESIQWDGKYIVSVNDSKTTAVITRYKIDTITGMAEETN